MAVVVDKGTVDAIHDAPEKVQMLESAASLLQPDGILISVSFATAAQVLLLRRVAAKLQLKLALLIVQAQKEIRLLSLLGRSWDTSIIDSLGDQELTKRELAMALREFRSILDSCTSEHAFLNLCGLRTSCCTLVLCVASNLWHLTTSNLL